MPVHEESLHRAQYALPALLVRPSCSYAALPRRLSLDATPRTPWTLRAEPALVAQEELLEVLELVALRGLQDLQDPLELGQLQELGEQ